jgi:calcineurin-like phosphoesterase family protein
VPLAEIYFISDTHFFHANILKFVDDKDNLIRPGFENVEHMNEVIVTKWNTRVKPGDHVYHLGDVAFKVTERNDDLHKLLSRLNGKKRLVVGNHDDLKQPVLHKYFQKIMLWRGFKDEGFTCSHIPLRLDSIRDGSVNVHGHLHQNLVNDPHYINVCVEHTDYSPVSLEEIKKIISDRNL